MYLKSRQVFPACLAVFAMFLCLTAACSRPNASASRVDSSETITPTVEPNAVLPEPEEDEDPVKVEYKGFTIEKRLVVKTEGQDNPRTEIFDVVISKNGRHVKTIAGDYHPLGNSVSIELTSLLGGEQKQLIVSASWGRDDRIRVVSLDNGVEVLFDSGQWEMWITGGEPADFDGDGVFEMVSWVRDGYGLCSSYNCFVNSSLIFKFDPKTRRFLPANHLFPDESMKELSESLAKHRRAENQPTSFAEVMTIYLYAGKEAEAWKFFNENAAVATAAGNESRSNEEIRRDIIASLKTNRYYQYVRNATRTGRDK